MVRETPPKAPQDGSEQKGPQRPRFGPLWWVFVVGLLIWYLIIAMSQFGAKTFALPYSDFIAQLRGGNVASVHITGDQIEGKFVKPYVPPHVSASPAPQAQKAFQTIYPSTIGDPRLMTLLAKQRVPIDVSSAGVPWFLEAIVAWLPWLLLIGFFIWMVSAARGAGGLMSGFGKIKAKRYSADGKQPVTFDDVAGADQAKGELQEEVDFLRHSQKYRDLGARIPRGVLLVGPPGTGKTLLARAVAGEAGVQFFSLNASEFVEMFVGVGASRVRDLFQQAKEAAPAIVFIDELDAVGRRRGAGLGTINDEREQTLNQLLGELDGFDQRFDVIILAATNRPDVLDPALLRPGRFDRQVVIELPDRAGREGILRIHTRPLRLAPDVDLSILAGATIGMSGADIANLCNEAALTAARRNHATVAMADFDEAQDKIRLGAAHERLADPNERRVTAYHESGHALVAWMTPNADPVHKVTIVPHGQALGQTQQIPDTERHNLSLAYLKARLVVALAGRSAEEIVLGEITTGAEQDLVEATRLARRMVTRWGMGEIGLLAFKADEEQPFLGYELSQGRDYSEAMAARIDTDVERLLEQAHQAARACLTAKRDRLEELAQTLLREETVGLEQLNQLLGPRAA